MRGRVALASPVNSRDNRPNPRVATLHCVTLRLPILSKRSHQTGAVGICHGYTTRPLT